MKQFKILVTVILGFCALLPLSLSVARAQTITGTISGIVTDPTGAVIPGATVAVTALSTNLRYTAVTDGAGFYSFPVLPVDHYTVTLAQPGYEDFVMSGVTINANSAIRVDIGLQIGAVQNSITVAANLLQIETQNTQMGDVIEDKKIVAAPLNGRSFINLLALQPGVSPYTSNDTTNGIGVSTNGVSGNLTNGTQSVNGGRPTANGFMINGADAEEPVHNGAAMIPNLDSISEFRIITNNFDAEYGNFSGGQINVVTKSGSNAFHGDVFNFLRNTDLDAANYFAGGVRGKYIQNQFGGVFGGPVLKNRLFFFGDFQGTRMIQGATQSFAVPSLDDRLGNLADEESALETSTGVGGPGLAADLSNRLGYPVTQGEPYYFANCSDSSQCVFPNAVIPQSAWSPVAVQTLQYIPKPNANISNNPTFETSGYNSDLRDNKGGIRMDVNTHWGALFGYYYQDRYNFQNPYDQGTNIPGFTDANVGITQMVNLGLTTTFSPRLVNDARLVWLRDVNHTGQPVSGQGTGVSLASLGFNTPWNNTGGLSNINSTLAGVPSFFFNNYEFGLAQDALGEYNNTAQILDNVIRIVGRHTFKFGVDYHYDQINERNYDDANGAFGFTGFETGLDFSDFLIGAVQNFTQASQQLLDSRNRYFGVYGQDSWRTTPNLTFNYGLRYEITPPWQDTQNKLETVVLGEQSQAFPDAPLGLVVPGDPGIPKTLGPIKHTNFAPRIGLAYAPSANSGFLHELLGGAGQSSIRAGFGLFYSSIEDATNFVEVGDAPYGNYYSSPSSTQLASPFVDLESGRFGGVKFPFVFPPTNVSAAHPDTTFNWAGAEPIGGSDYYYPYNVVPYVAEYELSFERQLGSATVLDVSYVGNQGHHLLTFVESNPGNPALCLSLNQPGALSPDSPTSSCQPAGGEDSQYILANGTVVNGTRPFGLAFSSNPYMETAAHSSFNSLQATVQHNDKYDTIMLGYTWEKSMDNGSGAFDATNPFHPEQSVGLSTFDVPQDFVASYTVNLPFDKLTGNGGALSRITNGWQLSGITTFASGEPISVRENDDNSLIGAGGVDVPSVVPGQPLYNSKNPRSGQAYFNPGYFTFEPVGQVGNAMRRFFTGPGILNTDLALLKSTKVVESQQLQFRAETFNTFNHAQFDNPSGQVDNTGLGGFGYIHSARDPRIMQVALKYIF